MEPNQEEEKFILDDGAQQNQANDFSEKKDICQPGQILQENVQEHNV